MPKDFKRSDRIGEQIQRELAQLIQREVRDPRLGLITLTAVKIASDLSLAKVYVTQLDDSKPVQETITLLNKMASFLRFRLANIVELRIAPHLKFIYDASISHGNHLASLINNAVADDERKHAKQGETE